MKKRNYLLLGLLLIVAAWVCGEIYVNSHWFHPTPPADVRIEVSGRPGAKVNGTFEVDGVASQQSGVLPTSFSFSQARRLKFTITREAGAGELWAKVFINDEQKGEQWGGAEWVRGMIERGAMYSTAGQGEPQGLW